ncbi:MAG: DUF2085 domain-containing protein [Anaerolineae bacterium]
MDVIRFLLSGICHQYPEHSLWVQGQPLPLCMRCTGMYLGALITLVTLALIDSRRHSGLPRKPVTVIFGILLAAWALDGLNSTWQYVTGMPLLYLANNLLRLITGAGAGVVVGFLLYSLVCGIYRMRSEPVPTPERPWQLGVVIMVVSGVIGTLVYLAHVSFKTWVIGLGTVVFIVLGAVNQVLLHAVLDWRRNGFLATLAVPIFILGPILGLAELSIFALIRISAGLGGLAY